VNRPALILDAGQRQSLVAVRALGRAGIGVVAAERADRLTPAFASRWCSGRAVLPDVGEGADLFVDRVIGLCEAIGRPVVISSHDGSIAALRSSRHEVEEVASLALASEDPLSVAIDKRATLAVARRLGIEVPRTETITSMSAAGAAISEIGLPVVVKPVVSWVEHEAGGWGSGPAVAGTADAALSHIRRLVNGGAAALVQPWLPGSRDAVSVFLADGVVWAKFAVRSDRMFPVIGGDSIVRETIPMPGDIGPMAEALVRELSLEGYAEVEFRRDAHGRPFLMEINPRLNCGVEVAVRAGVNVPLLVYRWAAGEPLQPALAYRISQRMRWLNGDVRWLAEVVRDPENPDAPPRTAAVRKFFADFARPSGYDYYDRGDARPALSLLAGVARTIPKRVRANLRLRRHECN
jgi:predicted ATP-grasp superfamily ATP-dependent carboligase